MNRQGNMYAIIILVCTVLGLIFTVVSLYLQLHPANAADYEETIAASCRVRGYEYAKFTDEPAQPQCCRLNYCVSYETAMKYGPGYEPTGGGSSG